MRQITKAESYLFNCLNSLCLMIFGIAFNFIAITNNGGKMPVLFNEFVVETEKHLTYTNKTDTNYWYFTDIFNLKNQVIFSIEDILIIIGLIFVVLNFIFFEMERINGAKSGARRKKE